MQTKTNKKYRTTVCQLQSRFLFVYGLTVICMDFVFYVFFFLVSFSLCVCVMAVHLFLFDSFLVSSIDCTQYALQIMWLRSFTHISNNILKNIHSTHYSMHVISFFLLLLYFGDNSLFFSLYVDSCVLIWIAIK